MMGVNELHYYDLYAPLVASVKLEYTPEEAQKLVLAAVAPLGARVRRHDPAGVHRPVDRPAAERRQALGRLLERQCVRRAPVHADQLQRPVQRRQHAGPRARATRCRAISRTRRSRIPTADYPIFVAEVASTFNESLLIDYMLKQIKDDDARLSILGSYLENIKGTVFRQTQFAEFELRMHEMAQKGQPITGDALAKLYLDITRRYYGHDQGVCGRGRLHRPRVELHSALLPRLLRVPVRHVVHGVRGARRQGEVGRRGGHEALPDVPRRRRLEVPDRSAEGRRRGHDHRRAARPHHAGR